jgi:hypothetical protein
MQRLLSLAVPHQFKKNSIAVTPIDAWQCKKAAQILIFLPLRDVAVGEQKLGDRKSVFEKEKKERGVGEWGENRKAEKYPSHTGKVRGRKKR